MDEHMKAATLICLRLSPQRLPLSSLPPTLSQGSQVSQSVSSLSSFQVLLGQNEIINWLKSTSSSHLVPMRYPGEWKFPGGVYDPDLDDALESTAIRELQEEFLGLTCPPDNILRPLMRLFNQKCTLPIQGRSYEMNNYLIVDPQQQQLRWDEEEIAKVNQKLLEKKIRFMESLSRNEYWDLSYEERLPISPEVHQIQWIDLDEAISLMESSLTHQQEQEGEGEEGTAEGQRRKRTRREYVNVWQQEQFEQYGITRRDPMYQSMMTLREIRDAMRAEEEQRQRGE
jgi:8-oxo-dGTP pyrophosphatase MutT (NUDIX family)